MYMATLAPNEKVFLVEILSSKFILVCFANL